MPVPPPAGLFVPATAMEALIRQVLLPGLKEGYSDLLSVCQGADILVSGSLTYAAPLVAEKLGVPWVSTAVSPAMFDSVLRPSIRPQIRDSFLPMLGRVRSSNPISWAAPVDDFRRELGLPVPHRSTLAQRMISPWGTLALFSKDFAPARLGWPRPTWITGFTWYDRREEGRSSPELQEFLSRGDAPLVFTLGDSTGWFPGDFYTHSLEAVRRMGCRAVFLTRTPLISPLLEKLRHQILVTEYTPYSEIFPYAAVVVHAGGIGAIASCLRAGRPMLVIPWAYDQPDNSRRAVSLGVARLIERPNYNAQTACDELRSMLSNPEYARRAAEIGSRLIAEDGAADACERIEVLMAHSRRVTHLS